MTRFNILLIGKTSSGKSQFLKRFITNTFDVCTPTIGIECVCRDIIHDNNEHRLLFWDATGNIARFGNLIEDYYKRAHGILVFKQANDSLQSDIFEGWISIARERCSPNTPIILVSTKSDKIFYRLDTDKCHPTNHLPHITTSAKTGENIENVIYKLVSDMVKIHGNTNTNTDTAMSENQETEPLLSYQIKSKPKLFECCTII